MPNLAEQNIAAVVIRNDAGLYLLIQEIQDGVPGPWNNTGGHQDPGEELRETAQREAKEEINVEIELLEDEPIYRGYVSEKNHDYYAFLGRIAKGTIKVQKDEIADARWFSFTEVERLFIAGELRHPVTMASIQKVENAHSRH